MYTFPGRIRFSETTQDGYLTITSLIDYLQDCSSFQSEDLGIGSAYLHAHHFAWLVNYWQIDILRLPKLGEYVNAGTSPYGLKGFMGFRNFMLETSAGERLVNANSIWSLFDMQEMTPVKVPQIMIDRYEVFPRFAMEYLPRKIALPDAEAVSAAPVMVDYTMLDSNRHMNNAQYVRIALSLLPQELQKRIARIRVEYRQQAHEGDVIMPLYWHCEAPPVILMKEAVEAAGKESSSAACARDGAADGGQVGALDAQDLGDTAAASGQIWTLSLQNREGKPYAIIEMSW